MDIVYQISELDMDIIYRNWLARAFSYIEPFGQYRSELRVYWHEPSATLWSLLDKDIRIRHDLSATLWSLLDMDMDIKY